MLPCEATTRPEQVDKGNTNKTVYIEDQVGFLKIRKSINLFKCQNNVVEPTSLSCVYAKK